MDIEVIIEKNNKDFRLIKSGEVILKGHKPSVFSSETRFFFNSATHVIKKKSFWSMSFNLLRGGVSRGMIKYNWKKGYSIIIYDETENEKLYTMKAEASSGWFSSDRLYSLMDNDEKTILKIDYSTKKWKEHIKAELVDQNKGNYELLMYALYLMRLYQSQSSGDAGASVMHMG